jgi:DNA transposition AAA+ family ATPase
MEDNQLQVAGKGTIKVPGDIVYQATAELPDAQRSAIRRFHSYYMDENLSLDAAAELIRFESGAILSQVFRGKYGAKLDNIVAEIESFFELQDKRSLAKKLPFIETSLSKRIWGICDVALEFQKMSFIFGDSQIGKTTALREWARRHNHGSAVYVRVPTGGALLNFMTRLASALHISTNMSITKLRERIIGSFDSRMVLIVDEAHACIRESGNQSIPLQTIEFVREIYDETACGVVFSATNVFRDAMASGAVSKILRQTRRRGLPPIQLPNVPPRADMNIFAAAYGLPASSGPARELEERMINHDALGMWLSMLHMGAKVAAKRRRAMTWNDVISAKAGMTLLEGAEF